MHIEAVGSAIVDAAVQLHRKLGPGLLESVYHSILARDLAKRGFSVENKKFISFDYEGLWFENAFCADIVVERQVIIEVKSVRTLSIVHQMQLLTYLRLTGCKLGFLLNFGAPTMKEGIKRVVNNL